MPNKTVLIFICIIFISVLFSAVYSQENNYRSDSPEEILIEIQESFEDGDIAKIAPYLSSKTYLSISEEISGYFSYSQAYNMLSDYFKIYRPLNFKFASMVNNQPTPFAWGEYRFLKNGVRGEHKIFVSLQSSESSYFISQITIN